jgi:hypothetical protein
MLDEENEIGKDENKKIKREREEEKINIKELKYYY